MQQGDAEDRTETATARRLQRAREQGSIAVSPEVSPLLVLGAAGLLLSTSGYSIWQAVCSSLAALLAASGRIDGSVAIGRALNWAIWDVLRAICGIGLSVLAAASVAGLLQTGFLLNPRALVPDIGRLDPRRGLKRVFGAANLQQAAKSLLKLSLIGAALWRLLQGRSQSLMAALGRSADHIVQVLWSFSRSILITALCVQAGVAVIDLVVVRVRHAKSLRMTRAEVREESREANGNPEIKAKLRRLRALRARHRMADAVKRATVVVTNPTHYAVALAYDRSRNAAPRVVAKGMDEMAARIRALAEENRVPIVANPPLARALHKIELDNDIPTELYQAVAEIIAYVWRLQSATRRRRA